MHIRNNGPAAAGGDAAVDMRIARKNGGQQPLHPGSGLQSAYAEHAVTAMTTAIRHGYVDAVYLESEPDLDPLRDRADFQSLVEHLPRARED